MPLEGPSVDGDVGPAVNAFTPDDQVRRRSVRYGPCDRPAPTPEFPRDSAKAPAKAVQPARLGVTDLALLWSEQVPLVPPTCSVAVVLGHCASNCGTTMPSCMRTTKNSGLHARPVAFAQDSSRWGTEASGQQLGEADAWDDLLGPAVSVHRDPEFPADGGEVEGHARRALLHVLHVLQQQVDFSPAGGGPYALARRPVVQRRQRLVEPDGIVARLELRYQTPVVRVRPASGLAGIALHSC